MLLLRIPKLEEEEEGREREEMEASSTQSGRKILEGKKKVALDWRRGEHKGEARRGERERVEPPIPILPLLYLTRVPEEKEEGTAKCGAFSRRRK